MQEWVCPKCDKVRHGRMSCWSCKYERGQWGTFWISRLSFSLYKNRQLTSIQLFRNFFSILYLAVYCSPQFLVLLFLTEIWISLYPDGSEKTAAEYEKEKKDTKSKPAAAAKNPQAAASRTQQAKEEGKSASSWANKKGKVDLEVGHQQVPPATSQEVVVKSSPDGKMKFNDWVCQQCANVNFQRLVGNW